VTYNKGRTGDIILHPVRLFSFAPDGKVITDILNGLVNTGSAVPQSDTKAPRNQS